MKTLNAMKQPAVEALKERFVAIFCVRRTNAMAMQQIVATLAAQGVTRKTLVAWAVQGGGYTHAYAANLIGRILRAIGFRARRKRAGRKRSREGLDLLVMARAKYGARFLKALRAAYRAGKEQTAVCAPDCAPPGSGHGIAC
jgi:hypothetical protein